MMHTNLLADINWPGGRGNPLPSGPTTGASGGRHPGKTERSFWFFCALGLAAVTLSACQGFDRVDPSKGFTRASWQHPDRVIQELQLEPDSIIADLGAGEGYFALRFARALPRSKVYAVEVTEEQRAALDQIRRDAGVSNLKPILGEFADPLLPEPADLIFLCNTYHHIENQTAYFALIREKYLKPGGRVATIDHRHDMSGVMRLFLSQGHWSDPTEVRRQMRAAGYLEMNRLDFLPNQNFQIFEAER